MNKRSESGEIKFNVGPLLNLQKAAAQLNGMQVHVGVLGDEKNQRKDGSAQTNAEIGALHEYGSKTRNIPRRSFLQMPMVLYFGKNLQESKDNVIAILNKSGAIGFCRSLAVIAEQTIDKAFESSGFGNWKANAPSTIRKKKSAMPLIDTGELRSVIASRIVQVSQ